MRKESRQYEADVRNDAQVLLSQKELEKAYSGREIDQLFKASDERVKAFHEKLMARMDDFEDSSRGQWNRIETQTMKTNGYVADLIRWKWILIGFCACITIIVLPTLLALVQSGKI
jgi:hypothetical protein